MNDRRQKDRRNGSVFTELEGATEIKGRLTGRKERRLPIIIVVRLAQGVGPDPESAERTYTDNVSQRGARVFSKHPWQPGDLVWIVPINEEPALGEVVYCQRLADDCYSFGVQFEGGPVTWSILERYARP